MINRIYLEKLLQLNGVSATAKDEEIKEVLLSAKWHKDDVETALTVLRRNVNTNQDRVDSLHYVFNTDKKLKPETIQSLLGIDVDLSSEDIANTKLARKSISITQISSIIILSVLFATVMFMSLMWYAKIGLFFSPQ